MNHLKNITQGVKLSEQYLKLVKALYFFLACLFFLLGFIGVFLPLLPTTPFMILSAYLFSKSSKKAYNWLVYKTGFGPMIRDWKTHKKISLKYKIIATSVLGLSLISIWMSSCIFVVQVSLTIFFIFLSFFIWKQKG